MIKVLFLDDDPARAALAYTRWPEEKRSSTIWCKTVKDALSVLKQYKETLLEAYLDHDLEGEAYANSARSDCGMELVRFFENISEEKLETYKHIQFTIHSHNIPAGRSMTARMLNLGLKAKHIPFGMTGEIMPSKKKLKVDLCQAHV